MKKCVKCGVKIPKERLEILPNTELCIKCSQKYGPQKLVGYMVYDGKTGGDLVTVDPSDEESMRLAKRAHRREME